MEADERQAGGALSSDLLPRHFSIEMLRVLQRICERRGERGTPGETQDDLMFHLLCGE